MSEPGYYRVLFADNGTVVEASAAQRSGMFRFTFPAHVVPKIFVGDAGNIDIVSKRMLHLSSHHAVIDFSEGYLVKANNSRREYFYFFGFIQPCNTCFKNKRVYSKRRRRTKKYG